MVIIDPLRLKIQELLEDGQANPLNQARLRYGTEKDLDILIEEIKWIKTHKRKYIFIDFTPFERIGRVQNFISRLNELDEIRPVLMVISDSLINEFKKHYTEIPILVAKYQLDGFFQELIGGSEVDSNIKDSVLTDLIFKTEEADLIKFRKIVTQQNLIRILFNPNCLDVPRQTDPTHTVEEISGRYYRVMPNDMLVSCYLNLKEIGNNYKSLTKVAYEIVLEIYQYFTREVDPINQFNVLVTPNNTSLFLASAVQAIIGKPIICIDKLGPIPALNLNSELLSKFLKEQHVVLIEEVTATGNEIDRAIFFLNNMKATIFKIIAIYNLEVGQPMLEKKENIISLCKPKKELKYEYRSR